MSIYHCGKLIAGKGEDGENDIEYLSQSEYEDKRRSGTLDPKKYYATPQDEEREKCVSYVIQTGRFCSVDGTVHENDSENDSWYRLYSDGWCEMGGNRKYAEAGQQDIPIILLKSYTDDSYGISISSFKFTSQFVCITTFETVTQNSFIIRHSDDGTTGKNEWHKWKTEGFVS